MSRRFKLGLFILGCVAVALVGCGSGSSTPTGQVTVSGASN